MPLRLRVMNRENRPFTDLQKVVILELPKLPQKEDSAVWSWMQFFKCKEMEEFEMLAARHPELEKPVRCVKYMSLRESWQTMVTRRRIRKLDENTWKDELLEQGREEEKLEIARNLKMMGLPISQIAEGTGLLLETIEQL